MAEASKDTIYIDIDDEITGIIDKVTQSKHKIVALVLPKRASVLQSIVNMKLLKRSGDAQKKKLVLITSEAGLLPLAGAVKLHVAKTLQSKPAIPAAPDVPSDDIGLEDGFGDDMEDEDNLADEPVDSTKPVGELAAAGAGAGAAAAPDEPVKTVNKPAKSQQFEETIDIDDDGEIEDTSSSKDAAGKKSAKKGDTGDKKLKIPNFEKFRTKLLIGGAALIVLIIGWYITSFVLPTAKITVITDNVSVNTEITPTVSTKTEELDVDKGLVPGTELTVKKTDAEKVSATGKKNVGEKSVGTVSIKLTNCPGNSVTVPAGTGVSDGGLTFILQKSVTFFPYPQGNVCANQIVPQFTTATINVVAQNPGDQYNISGGRNFTVSGFSNVVGFDSSAMTGGTSKEVTVVSDDDIASAKEKLKDKSKAAAINELKQQLKDKDLFAISETITSSDASVVASPTVGSESADVTVTSIVTYAMLGAKRDDLKALVVESVKDKINPKQQKIGSDGLDQAVIKVSDQSSPTTQKLSIQTTVSTGAQEDQDALKKEIANKKKGQIQQFIGERPGVKEVKVSFSPFWVFKAPNNPAKITIEYVQASDGASN